MKCNTLTFKSRTEYKNYLMTIKPMPSMVNRPLSESHIKRMGDSIKQIGVQRAVVVIETAAFGGGLQKYSGDAHHLKWAILNADKFGLFGHYVAFENKIDTAGKIILFIAKMNSTAKNWGLNIYLNSWCTDGKKDYLFIRDEVARTGYGISSLVEIYADRRAFGNHTFKEGKFVAQKDKGAKVLELYNLACGMGFYKSSTSFNAFARFCVDHSEREDAYVLNAIQKNKQLFSKKFKREGYLALLRNLCLKS